jgi:hypothetical protein
MKIQEPAKPESLSIFIPNGNPNKVLTDYRIVRRYGGMSFGTVSQLARNYGITMKNDGNGLLFSGPRSRLQMFAEKLHFSLIEYYQV